MCYLPRHSFTKFRQINDYAPQFIENEVKFTPGTKTQCVRNPLVNILAKPVPDKFLNVFDIH